MPLPSTRSKWSCFSAGVLAGRRHRLPDMPRCRISVPCSNSTSRYLPRRLSARMVLPCNSFGKFFGIGQRSLALRMTTFAMVWPVRCLARPRRVTSTSGSSGTAAFPPDINSYPRQQQRQGNQETGADDGKLCLAEHQIAVPGGTRLNGDEMLFAGQPIHHVHAQIHVAAVAGEAVGKKCAVADHHDALFAVVDVALYRHCNDGGAGRVVLLVETRFSFSRIPAHPAAGGDLHHQGMLPFRILVPGDGPGF